MKLTLLSDNAIRFEPRAGPFTVVSSSPELHYSPFHMMAGALAHCSFSVMQVWAEHTGLSTSDLILEVSWEFAERPHRVGRYDLRFSWPSLPAVRLDTARRVAETCAIHATFRHPPLVTTEGTLAPIEAAEHTHP